MLFMKVYVARVFNDKKELTILGVYSSKAKALASALRFVKTSTNPSCTLESLCANQNIAYEAMYLDDLKTPGGK